MRTSAWRCCCQRPCSLRFDAPRLALGAAKTEAVVVVVVVVASVSPLLLILLDGRGRDVVREVLERVHRGRDLQEAAMSLAGTWVGSSSSGSTDESRLVSFRRKLPFTTISLIPTLLESIYQIRIRSALSSSIMAATPTKAEVLASPATGVRSHVSLEAPRSPPARRQQPVPPKSD